jgi:nucleotide-binding universal stress UspA family protein
VILIAYDGSADAQAAIDQAGSLMNGESATVLTVWEPFVELMTRTGVGFSMGAGVADIDAIDSATEQAARDRAREGAERARGAGLNAQPRSRAQETTIADAILAEANDVDARAIVVGTRGLTGVKSVLLGSVSNAVVHHAERTVIVVKARARPTSAPVEASPRS